jgi:hypothetical protein
MMWRQITLILAACLILCTQSASVIPGKSIIGGSSTGTPPPPPGVLSTFVTLVNESGSATTANASTFTFGQVFVDGDLCGGAAPIFKIGGVTQPFSASPANARTYWNSGCLRYSSFMLRPTSSIAGSGSATVAITGSGTWPTASSRTTTELYAQNLVVNAPAAPVSDAHVSTVGSWLKNDANNYRQIVWLDGDAGKCWRIDTNMAATQGAAAHTSLKFAHYICGLNNGSGNLAGFRWVGSFRQPGFNAAGAPMTYRVFNTPNVGTPTSGVNWQTVGPGGVGTTTTPLQWPFGTGVTFTSSGGNGTTSSPNLFYSGAGGPNIVPVYYSGLGGGSSLPSGSLTFLSENQGSTTIFTGCSDAACAGPGSSYGITGTGTVNPVVVIYPFGRVWTYNANGRYNFFQGTGTQSAETTLRVQIDQTYWQKTKIFPSFDLSVAGASPSSLGSGGPIADIVFPYDWNPYTLGSTPQDENGAGDHDDLGILMGSSIVDFYNQSAISEKLVRISSTVPGLFLYDFKDAASDNTVDFANVGTYGLPTVLSVSTDVFHLLCWEGTGTTNSYPAAAGFSQPTTNIAASPMGVKMAMDHMPEFSAWAYARFGQLSDLDMLEDMAQRGPLYECSYSTPGALTLSYPNGGIMTAWEGTGPQYRGMFGVGRAQQWTAMFVPYNPTNPTAVLYDGTKSGAYFNEVADASANYPLDQFNAGATVYGAANAYVQANGAWSMASLDFTDSHCLSNPCYQIDGGEWQKGFVYLNQLVAVSRGNVKAKTFLQNTAAVWWKHIGDTFGYWPLYHYYEQLGPISSCSRGHADLTLNTSDTQWNASETNFWFGAGATEPTFSGTGPPYFNAGAPQNSYTPKNGDGLRLWCGAFGNTFLEGPVEMAANTTYYMVNASPTSFDLTTSQSEALANNTAHRLVISGTNYCGGCGGAMSVQIQTYGPTAPTTNASAFMGETIAIIREVAAWAKALGVDSGANGFQAVLTDANFRFANTTGVCSGSPCGAGGRVATSPNGGYYQYVGGLVVDPRYNIQAFFAP